jgi:hypothetical protein
VLWAVLAMFENREAIMRGGSFSTDSDGEMVLSWPQRAGWAWANPWEPG